MSCGETNSRVSEVIDRFETYCFLRKSLTPDLVIPYITHAPHVSNGRFVRQYFNAHELSPLKIPMLVAWLLCCFFAKSRGTWPCTKGLRPWEAGFLSVRYDSCCTRSTHRLAFADSYDSTPAGCLSVSYAYAMSVCLISSSLHLAVPPQKPTSAAFLSTTAKTTKYPAVLLNVARRL